MLGRRKRRGDWSQRVQRQIIGFQKHWALSVEVDSFLVLCTTLIVLGTGGEGWGQGGCYKGSRSLQKLTHRGWPPGKQETTPQHSLLSAHLFETTRITPIIWKDEHAPPLSLVSEEVFLQFLPSTPHFILTDGVTQHTEDTLQDPSWAHLWI